MGKNRLIVLAVLAVVALLAIGWWRQHARAEDAERRLGIDASRVVTAVFANARDLRVATLTGQAVARSTNDGRLFATEQRTRAPYSVSYFVDLKALRDRDFAWNAANRTMVVRIPDVTVEAPAIDLSRAAVEQKGAWVSRQAGIALQQRGARYLQVAADRTARSDANIARARTAAVEAVRGYVRQPLAAAGLGDVRVEVLYPWQGAPTGERWNESRPLADVLRDAR